jgi:type II secretory ATPase GspE/PulE/Tfp pilus assembly ATPase PilB-like protein
MNPAAETTAPKLVEELCAKAERAGASDIHLQLTSAGAEISFRLDGVLSPANAFPSEVAERMVGRIKYLARLKTYQDSLPQDGRIDKTDVGASSDIRVSTYPTVTGEKIVLRLFSQEEAKTLAELQFPEEIRATLEEVLRKPAGLILLTGPAGSGKTSTIYAALRYLVQLGGRHVITVEDPVEQIVPGIMQTEVNEPRGLNFATAARHLLRQDPQVLIIGEVRDEETATICVRAASTGHLVLSTLHAGSCKGVFERLALLCRDAYAVSSSLELILNQRLVRRLCPKCAGRGCEDCLSTGYRGRVPIIEFCRINEASRPLLRKSDLNAINPVKSLQETAAELLGSGVTNKSEIARILP